MGQRDCPESFGPFKLFRPKRTTMRYGFHYVASLSLRFDERKKRKVRVWLPESYDFDNPSPHPVLYMADGQNLVDKYLTRFGDWHLDRVCHRLHEEEGVVEPILVGIDSPKEPQRMNELNPPYPVLPYLRKSRTGPTHPYGQKFVASIIEEVKPLVDGLFATDKRVEATGVGGASMGGIMAFYAFISHPEVFGYSHCFSAPFIFYSHKELRWIMEKNNVNPASNGKIYLYNGGKGSLEKKLAPGVVFMDKLFREFGFGDDQVQLAIDVKQLHKEEPWSKYSYPALKWWLKSL